MSGIVFEDMHFSWWLLIGATFGMQWMGFVFAYGFQTERFYDALGSLGFLLAVVYSFVAGEAWISPRACLATGAVVLWALRLGLFLVCRVHRDGKDKRFDKIKVNARRFFVAWTLQAVWVILTALPVYTLNGNTWAMVERVVGHGHPPPNPLAELDVVLLAVWVAGFAIQCVADWQKLAFRAVEGNKDKFITTGLWAYSQHPNYFGELLMWWSLAIFSTRGLFGLHTLTVMGPTVETLLLLFVSGIPLLDRAAEERWGKLERFRKYRDNTAILIPFVY